MSDLHYFFAGNASGERKSKVERERLRKERGGKVGKNTCFVLENNRNLENSTTDTFEENAILCS